MRPSIAGVVALAACTIGEPDAVLTLEGPDHVRVEVLGPVPAPRAVDAAGAAVAGVTWTVSPADVARFDGDEVVATRPGEAVVTGSWQGQLVQWHLVVAPEIHLRFLAPPARVVVGARTPLAVEALVGGQGIGDVSLRWSVQPDDAAKVDRGVLVGSRPGVVWVTVKHGAAEAMAEIEIVDTAPTP